MHYTLAEAAAASGKSKSTVLRSIRAGRISAVRDELSGGWRIEPAELHRLYPALVRDTPSDTPRNGNDAAHISELAVRLAAAETASRLRDEWLADLRARLDASEAERRRIQTQLTALLTDQHPPAPAAGGDPPETRWRRLWRTLGHGR